MYSLAISLGHNSSAVLIEDGKVLAGYEEERFTGVKADSTYPRQSIEELKARFKLPKDTDVYVGHWFIDAQLPPPNKYWDPQHIRNLFPNGSVDSLSQDFTHHDSHLESAMVFAGQNFAPKYHAVVADGFGSFGECISVYEVTGRAYRLLHRVFGFEKSLGMLYQYATAFMGMKMHNHEYKMLAYEVHLNKVLEWHQIQNLRDMVQIEARRWLQRMRALSLSSEFDPVTDIGALPNVQIHIDKMLSRVLIDLDMDSAELHDKRVIISYFVQRLVEAVMTTHISMYAPKSLLVVGGLFYNVKLNHMLANSISGRFCAMPLAGDQGAALGVYSAHKGDLVWPDHLNWGHRDLVFDPTDVPKGVVLVSDEDQAEQVMQHELRTKGWVNLVRGNMEFGPRALCNTSTIARPELEVTAGINKANDRTMEMPMAPVMTAAQAEINFMNCARIHKSLEYMVVTRTYWPGRGEMVPGAAHFYPEDNLYTGRPQITDDQLMVNLLKDGPLVNTSFNYHGVPIVRNADQILATHVAQWRAAPELQPTTVIIV